MQHIQQNFTKTHHIILQIFCISTPPRNFCLWFLSIAIAQNASISIDNASTATENSYVAGASLI